MLAVGMLLLDHMPVPSALLSKLVLLRQALVVPVIAGGAGFTEIIVVALQPVASL
jgi:hypothetical protein